MDISKTVESLQKIINSCENVFQIDNCVEFANTLLLEGCGEKEAFDEVCKAAEVRQQELRRKHAPTFTWDTQAR